MVKSVDWKDLRFGVEIEFIGGDAENLELLPEWVISLDELQIDETGADSGSELKTPPILWEDREQIRVMLNRLHAQGASVNWSCGLHVHIGLESWGQDIVLPLIDAALLYQHTIRALLQTSEHRLIFCPPVTREMRSRFISDPGPDAVHHRGRPQSHRCGINVGAWYDIGTVEIRYANGTLNYDEVLNTIKLCLRFVAAIGAGCKLSCDPQSFTAELEAPATGYPMPMPIPRWYQERIWLEESLFPAVTDLAAELVQDGEILHILPVSDGIKIVIEDADGQLFNYVVQPPSAGWTLVRQQ